MIVKVKEPQPQEARHAARGQVLFTYLHLGPMPQAEACWPRARSPSPTKPSPTGNGGLPLLAPMSEVAGRMSIQVGATACRRPRAAAVCCSAACRAWRRPRWWCSAAAWSAATRRRWPWAWARRRDGARPLARAPARPRRQFGGRVTTVYSTERRHRAGRARAPTSSSARAGARRRGAQARDRAMLVPCARRGAGRRRHRPGRLLRDLHPPRTPHPTFVECTAWCTTASPTCRARCRAPRPSR
jgi:hypothetical protein